MNVTRQALSISARAASLVLLSIAAAAALYGWSLKSELAAMRLHWAAARTAFAANSDVAPIAIEPDFTSQWPIAQSADTVMDSAIRDALRLGMRIKAASSAVHPDSTESLPQSELLVELQGRYSSVKAWLAETSAHQTGVAISGLEMRRLDGVSGAAPAAAPEVTATVRLRLFSRPRESR